MSENMRARFPLLAPIALGLLVLTTAASAQEVESVFLAALDGEGYYVANGGVGKLEVAALANLHGERPIEIGARLEAKKRFYGEQVVAFEATADLVRAGRRDSSGLDRWYLPGFFWTVSCSRDGRTISVNGERVGKSPVDFIIQLGMVNEPQDGDGAAEAPMQLEGDTVAESRKTRIVCGKYSPLPKP